MQKFERAQFEIQEYVESNHYGKFEIQPLVVKKKCTRFTYKKCN